MIRRDYYLQRLINNMWNGEIKVITGIRRCGKSVLLFELFYEHLRRENTPEDHIIRLELDQRRNYKLRNPITLCEYVEERLRGHEQEKFYLLIDEVQFTTTVADGDNGGMEVSIYDMLNELKSYRNLDVYVTGSNSRMLSKDIATEFRGRATQIHVYPLSFAEYYAYVGGERRAALDRYMLYGGLPRVALMSDDRDRKTYLSNLYEELYLKDIVERNSLKREDVLRDVLDYVASQVGSLTNPTNVANALNSMRHESVNAKMISDYLQYTMDAFLISVAKRYDVKGKSYFNYPNKYYYTDIGLRNARLNYRQYDPGHMMENIVYNELIQRGYSVDVGQITERTGDKRTEREIDFVVNDGDRRVYIQSAWQMDTEQKENSELRSLKLTGDYFKKVVLRMDIPHSYYDESGLFHCSLPDFLLGETEVF